MTTFAESCNDREMQCPWSDKLEAAQLIAVTFASDFASLCGSCRFKCLLEVSEVVVVASDVLNRGSRFEANRIATCPQPFQIARFE